MSEKREISPGAASEEKGKNRRVRERRVRKNQAKKMKANLGNILKLKIAPARGVSRVGGKESTLSGTNGFMRKRKYVGRIRQRQPKPGSTLDMSKRGGTTNVT